MTKPIHQDTHVLYSGFGAEGICSIFALADMNDFEVGEIVDALNTNGRFVFDAGHDGEPDEYVVTVATDQQLAEYHLD